MPMLLARRKPDDIAGANFLDQAALAPGPAAAGYDDQCLTQRMRVPSGAGAGLERDAGADDARRIGSRKQRIDADLAGEIVRRALAGRLLSRRA